MTWAAAIWKQSRWRKGLLTAVVVCGIFTLASPIGTMLVQTWRDWVWAPYLDACCSTLQHVFTQAVHAIQLMAVQLVFQSWLHIYVHLPVMGVFGGWGGADVATVCAAVAPHSDAAFWYGSEGERQCHMMLQRRAYGYLLMLILFLCGLMVWHCVAGCTGVCLQTLCGSCWRKGDPNAPPGMYIALPRPKSSRCMQWHPAECHAVTSGYTPHWMRAQEKYECGVD